jgi:hypothetical protein
MGFLYIAAIRSIKRHGIVQVTAQRSFFVVIPGYCLRAEPPSDPVRAAGTA